MTNGTPSARQIKEWLVARLAEQLTLSPAEIDVAESYSSYGLSSRDAVAISGDLEEWLGTRFSPTLLYDYPSVEALAHHLGGAVSAPRPAEQALAQGGGTAPPEPIAIIGLACRFPGAPDPAAFWRLVAGGVDAIREVPRERWDTEALFDPSNATPGKMSSRHGGFLEQVDQFDPAFFGISAHEAERLDPQQRLLLEVSWEALEDAGVPAERLLGTATGVFVGISTNDYGRLQLDDRLRVDAWAGTGNARSIAANRISYQLGLSGPSLAVDTACSSSLAALHLACRSLRDRECEMALVGAVNVMLSPEVTMIFAKAGLLAPDGRCKVFDARADGYVRGEGAGVVVLKRLPAAMAQGDDVYAVIRGSAVNQDGRTNGLMAPSGLAQEAVIRRAYGNAGIDPGEVGFVEAHGSGTALGDRIEAGALGAVMSSATRREACWIGSVKTNIGHLEAAAGMAGLIKTVLALRHRQVPPSIHYQTPNPMIDFAGLGLRVADGPRALPAGGGLARAGVSAFGFGGTNVHVVLEEPPPRSSAAAPRDGEGWQLLVLSARTPLALDAMSARLAAWLESHPETALDDVAFTLRSGRSVFECRRAILAGNRGHAVAILREARGDAGRDEVLPIPAPRDGGLGEPPAARPLRDLGREWLAGGSVDWQRAGEARRRAGLPTYPFERQRYWLEAAPGPQALPAPSPQESKSPFEDWFHLPVWQPAPLAPGRRRQAAETAPPGPSTVVVFCDEHGMGEALAARFRQAGRPVVMVRPGDAYGGHGELRTLNPVAPADYESLLDDLPAPAGEIVHLWSVGSCAAMAGDEVATAQALGLESVVHLVRALGERASPGAVGFTLAASGMADVAGGELVSPAKATLLGPCRVIPFEYPRFSCRCLDLELPDSPGSRALLVDQLWREIESGASDQMVAYRGRDRYVQSIVRAPLGPDTGLRLRRGGVYLLTGGLGGLGLSAARFLAAKYQARLVLLGRSALPPRERWESLRADALQDVSPTRRADEAIPHRIREVMAIEESGGELLLIEADVTDRLQMRSAVQAVRERFGALHGVFHTAGVIGAGMISFNPKESLARVLPPKLTGTLVLDEVLADVELDFLVLYSSLASLIGGTGQVAYSAANAFLDAFARQRSRRGRFTVAVGWGEWQWNVWEGFAPAVQAALDENRRRFGISAAEGFAALERILAQDQPHVAVLTRPFAALREWFSSLAVDSMAGAAAPAAARTPRIGDRVPALPPPAELERIIAEIWQRFFGAGSLGLDDNFFDAGGNSLVGLQIINELRRTLGVELPKVALFQAPTVRALARYLEAAAGSPPAETPLVAADARREPEAQDAVAIVGMGLRFPGARSVEQFWGNLAAGVESISYFTDAELTEVPAALLADPDYVKARPVLEDVDQFDADFFNYPPGEARLMDPQIRLFLETCWQALESSGYAVENLEPRVGVFAGANISTYLLRLLRQPGFVESVGELETVISNDRDSLTTSVSYKLNLKGPSLAIQTFCSTSAVAIHLACKSVLRNECEMALAGGVSVRVPSRSGYLYRQGDQYSPDGHTRSFDHRGRGTVFGDGAGVVVLKRLSAARRDGDHVHAVIRGSAVNNDGSLKAGFTAPSVAGQAEVVAAALADAGVKASELSYVEAHGTATLLGDPIEVAALTQAFRQQTNARRYCALGSVKTNIGHLDRAAGVASVIKTALALEHRQIPPSLHFERPNPDIPFDSSPFFVNAHLREWTAAGGPRRAGVNSLGIGGTNAHLVLEEGPAPEPSRGSRRHQLLLLSARSAKVLDQAAAQLAQYLGAAEDADLADVAYTLAVGRRVFAHRRAVVCAGRESALAALAAGDERVAKSVQTPVSRQITFLFPGAGDHYVGMAGGLYRDEPVFREEVDRCAGLLRARGEDDLLDVLDPPAGGEEGESSRRLGLARQLHPALFAVEYALARLLMSWGLKPRAMLGHGLGESVAACLAGVFTLDQALHLVAARGGWIDELPEGAMAAVDRVAKLVAAMELRAPSVPLLSSVTGTWITRKQALDPGYWARHLCHAVRFGDAAQVLLGEAEQVLLEVGPGAGLTSQVRLHPECDAARASLAQPTLRSACEPEADQAYLLATLGRLWQQGLEIDWRAFYQAERRCRLPLPTYPFERQSFWIDPLPPAAAQGGRLSGAVDDLVRQPRVEDWFYEPVWKRCPTSAAPASGADDQPGPRSAPWWAFIDSSPLADRLLERLAARGEQVAVVTAGTAYSRNGSRWELDPAEPDHYRRLVEEAGAQALLPRRILHLWGLADRASSIAETLDHGFHSLVYLARALSAARPENVELNVVSSGVYRVVGGEALRPLRATLTGPVQVVPMEYPSISVRHLDLDLPRPGSTEEDGLLDALVAEMRRPPSEREVALRDGERWVRSYVPRPLARPAGGAASCWRPGGVYLITGGLGGLGLAAAEHLAATCGARLVLVGRTALPPREQWDRVLAESDAQGGTARRIAKVRALEERGAELLVLAADVADRERMREVVATARERFGAIHGVLHTAGVPAAGLMHGKSAADFATVMAAKVHGTLVLEEVLREVPIDFLVLFSSITAIVGGGPGQVDYCAANAFLDAFAQARSHGGRRVVSIDWGEWRWNDWESSMAGLPAEALRSFMRNRERLGIDFASGMDALERILASDLSGVVVSPPDFAAMAEITKKYTIDLLLGSPPGERRGDRPAQADLESGAPPGPVQLTGGELEKRITAAWRRALGREQIGPDDNFFDLGGNSLLGLRVTSQLQRELRREILPLALFEAPTVRSLAAYLQPAATPAATAATTATAPRVAAGSGSQGPRQGIAVIGMAGRFPGAAGVEELWRNLLAGRESITFFSDEELLAAGVEPALLADRRYVKAGSVLADIDRFDAELFGESPREAELLDPQIRLFLECAWEALDNAGYDPRRYPGKVGVFGGANLSTYLLQMAASPELAGLLHPMQAGLANSSDSLTTRVSYKLNLRGPSVSVQTFCSTSGVATHLACESLERGDCDMALAGGVRVAVPHRVGYLYEPGGIESPDGHIRTFDARGQGMVLGNGVAIVVLKRLEAALASGDHVYAVIKGSAINNDGAGKVGYTAPSVNAVAEVVSQALEKAQVSAATISYVEAHGTATTVGDPIEIAALTRAFRAHAPEESRKTRYCAIGSVKSNLGHLDRAAGTTALIKTALALERAELPPSISFATPNPKLDLENSPFFVQTERTPWGTGGRPRRAGVNVQGIGGTNVHFILEEPPAAASEERPSRPLQMVVVSANSATALETLTDRLVDHLRDAAGKVDLPDVASTLHRGRQILRHRRFVVCRDTEDAIACLASRDEKRVSSHREEPGRRPVYFLFPGQGAQYPGMGRGLYQQEAVFRSQVDRCCQELEAHLGRDLREVLFPAAGEQEAAARELAQTELTHPALFVIEYALACQWMAWGIEPETMIGHSLGEYVAACLAGVFSLADALAIVTARGRLISELEPGAMLNVALPAAEVAALLGPGLSLAAVNGPQQSTVSGPEAPLAALEKQLAERGVRTGRLRTSHAFHSAMMDPVLERFRERVAAVPLAAPRRSWVSNVTGTRILAREAVDPDYWVRHLRQTVRFAEGARELLSEPRAVFLEVGPGRTLTTLVGRQASSDPVLLASLRPPQQDDSDLGFFLATLGKLWLAGVEVDWEGFYREERRRRVALPGYPFEGERYWLGPRGAVLPASVRGSAAAAGAKKADPGDWYYRPGWRAAPLPEPPAPEAETAGGSWLLFVDGCGVGRRLAEILAPSADELAIVGVGDRFARVSAKEWRLAPGCEEDYRRLLGELGFSPGRVVHLWSLTRQAAGDFAAHQEVGFLSLLRLARALGSERVRGARLEVVTNRLEQVSGGEPVDAAKATLVAASKVLPQEYPSLSSRLIEVDPDPAASAVAAALACELRHGPAADLEVAYRGGARWLRHFEAVRLQPASSPAPLRDGGVYLITGGLGGVGLVLAEELARRHRARLALVSRSGLPERERWQRWVADRGEDDPTSRKIRRIEALEELGAEVLVLAADVGDAAAMAAVLASVDATYGELHGVLHAAGVTGRNDFQPVQQTGRDLCDRHFQAKVHGLEVLGEVLGDRRLDFCLLFSSLSSVLGGLGFAAYAAASCYLHGFARARRHEGDARWLSVAWDSWRLDAGAGTEARQVGLDATAAQYSMTPAEGAEAFARVLAAYAADPSLGPVLVHSTGDLETRVDQWLRRAARPPASRPEGARYTRPDLRTAFVPVNNESERKVARVFAAVLGVEKVGIHDNYFDLGGTSLTAIQVVTELQREFVDAEITPVTLFDAPTVAGLARALAPDDGGDRALGRLRAAVAAVREPAAARESIAIIGMSGRFPGAPDVDRFWQNLVAGIETVSFFTDQELAESGVDPRHLCNPDYVRARPILDDVDQFDAAFFGYSPREAELMDPQMRLLMETSWQALESAGYAAGASWKIGMFAGSNFSTYFLSQLRDPSLLDAVGELQLAITNDRDSLSTSISYKLNLKGPSLTVQTFCSTSAVAVHLACLSLRQGDCEMALAGGVSLRVPAKVGYLYQAGDQVSPDGHTRAFDHRAGGTVFGDGVGVVVLKRLSDALRDGDQIQAVLRGSAINNDGSGKAGYTAPSVEGQAECVAAALANAGVEAAEIGYVEAHGTATVLGDPIEVAALTRAFRLQTADRGFCALGSVKTNMGHLDRAAGVTALIKTTLALEHGQIPPSLHFERPNPRIDFAASPFFVNTELREWQRGGRQRLAGVNSLGVGGTNVHFVLEEAPALPPTSESRRHQLLVVSARSEAGLAASGSRLAAHLESAADCDLADAAYTLAIGRKELAHRRIVVCADRAAAVSDLAGDGRSSTATAAVAESASRQVAFLFPGIGEHYVGMAQGLYRDERLFRDEVNRCASILAEHGMEDLVGLLYPEPKTAQPAARSGGLDLRAMLRGGGQADEASVRLNRIGHLHPALFVIEYALARLLMAWGLVPQAMLGYSLGEYVAACLSGVFSLEDALRLMAARGRWIEELAEGAMLAVPLAEAEIAPALAGGLDLAAVNGAGGCVVSGSPAAIAACEERLAARGEVSRRLRSTRAFHSRHLEPVAGRVIELLSGMELGAPRIPFLSNVTGTWITPQEATDPGYWAQHLCRTVRFSDGVAELLREPSRVLVEVGPGQGLTSFVRLHPDCDAERAPRVRPTLRASVEERADQSYLLECLGRLWLAGVAIDWRGFYGDERRRRLRLPTYPFERQSYWLGTPRPASAGVGVAQSLADLVRQPDVEDWLYAPVWERSPPASSDGPGSTADRFWVFLDGTASDTGTGAFSARLAQRLEDRGDEVVRIFRGPGYLRQGRVLSLDPGRPDHYRRMVQELGEAGHLPGKVVHLWDLECEEGSSLAETLDRGFHSLIYLAQALGPRIGAAGSSPGQGKVQVNVISQGVHPVSDADRLRPERATVIGPVTLMPLEYPSLACRHFDVQIEEPGSESERHLLEQLVAELDSAVEERLVAYRSRERFVRRFPRRPLPPAPAAESPRFRRGGVYLITGGLGGLGLATAEHLAATLRARLVLVGRAGLPPREEWDRIMAGGDPERAPARGIARVRALEEQGIELLVLRADVADREQMRAVVDASLARFGALHGVLHAAGVPAAGLMQHKIAADFAQVLGPKVQGTRVLDEVLRRVPLDFLVLFSSATAVSGGGPGQVDYCAANAFVDAFAQARSTADRFVVSIGWNEWRWNAWEAAMESLPPQARRCFVETRERLGIDFAGGMDALERIVAADRPHFVVSPPDFAAALALSRDYTIDLLLGRDHRGPALAGEGSDSGVGRHARPELKVAYAPPAGDLERRIAAIWQRALGIEDVGVSDNFFDLGGNSLIGLRITSELQRELGQELLPVALYEAPTVADLARHLQSAGTRQAVPHRGPAAIPEAGIAIVGMAGRFPGAASVEELWRNLLAGREGVTFFSDQELIAAGVDPALVADPRYVKAGAVLDDIERFDADLFDVAPAEAALLDPQHRLFLECAWAALEDAGYDPARHPGRIGVFGGSHLSTYLLHLATTPELDRGVNRRLAGQCNSTDTLTTRVSYKLNLRGPSVAVQTFSSTSGVAIHLAGESLQRGSCEMALAGGVQVSVPHRVGYLCEPDGIDSHDGHTRSFDVRARGALQGNGVAIVVLKRLPDALHDGDHIYAVIKGSAINNDGSGKVGFTAPSVNAVAAVVEEALGKAGVSPHAIGYVEANGSATQVGDAIEVAALTRAFRAAGADGNGDEKTQYCALGSVKSNLGHLLIAAGTAAVIKTALALKHGEIPPNPTFTAPNPQLLLEQSPFYVQQGRGEWWSNGAPRRAGVNIQGVGGTNVHFILEEPPPIALGHRPSMPQQLLVLSANTASALEAMTDRLITRLREASGGLDLADVCATLRQGRKLLRHRRFVVCRDVQDAISSLESRDARRVSSHFEPLGRRPVCFLFPGQGEPHPGIGRELYEHAAEYRSQVDALCQRLVPQLGCDLRELLLAAAGGQEAAARQAAPAELRQPVLFVVEYALARQWMAWGVEPQAVLGEGIGEYVAACLTGGLSVPDALPLVAARCRLTAQPEDQAPSLDDRLDQLLDQPRTAFLEVGPGRALVDRMRARAVAETQLHASLPQPAGGGAELANVLDALGKLWQLGVEIDWQAFGCHERRRRVPLPTYPFEGGSHWLGSPGPLDCEPKEQAHEELV